MYLKHSVFKLNASLWTLIRIFALQCLLAWASCCLGPGGRRRGGVGSMYVCLEGEGGEFM